MTVNPDDEVRVIKIKGITKQEEEDTTAEKYISVANKWLSCMQCDMNFGVL